MRCSIASDCSCAVVGVRAHVHAHTPAGDRPSVLGATPPSAHQLRRTGRPALVDEVCLCACVCARNEHHFLGPVRSDVPLRFASSREQSALVGIVVNKKDAHLFLGVTKNEVEYASDVEMTLAGNV